MVTRSFDAEESGALICSTHMTSVEMPLQQSKQYQKNPYYKSNIPIYPYAITFQYQ
jgi:hypothetical protein